MALTSAEKLLQELGITEPQEIDLEAIAYHVGARVRYRPLDGCEARIVGYGDKAIIAVNDNSSPRRARFSIAHELGHWKHHRGQKLACRVEDYHPRDRASPERLADTYAADLLMPHYLFRPIAHEQGKLTLKGFHLTNGGEQDAIFWYDPACQTLINQRSHHAHLTTL